MALPAGTHETRETPSYNTYWQHTMGVQLQLEWYDYGCAMGLHTTHNGWAQITAPHGDRPAPLLPLRWPCARGTRAHAAPWPSAADHHENLRQHGIWRVNDTLYTLYLDYDSNGYLGAGSV